MTTPAKKPPPPVEERLFSLVLALVATRIGLTKNEILQTVQGYSQRYVHSGDNENLERQFERDKDELRDLGVPLEVVDDHTGNNHDARYRISKDDYELPAGITFTPDEMTLLSLAAMVWKEGSLSADSRRAITKLRSLDLHPDEPIIGYAPQLRVRDSAFEPLQRAMDRYQVVSFDYVKPGATAPGRRTVEPLALVQHDGRWLLNGNDLEAGARRTFLLSRIVSPVRATGKSFPAPGSGHADRTIEELDALLRSNSAELRVTPGSDAQLRLSRRAEGTTADAESITVNYTDLALLADELAGYGPEVQVVAPDELQRAVRDRLLLVAEAHAEPGRPADLRGGATDG
ncbi:YafY family protein [Homoserinimonas sp. OAct 916]|uniref:helix-turn-helix transcriptional regulator n=1 Tax=Homoserinimonas sp. OAct 916 TaxID=2211450 RepID=UPI000DBE9D6B|nr:WYL domain-containing protein [Homoserinimonas sp. OAct 916]